MCRKICVAFVLFFWAGCISVFSQQDTVRKPIQWQTQGYFKDLRTFFIDPTSGDMVADNLLHNRINNTFSYGSQWTLSADLRTRIFYGDVVTATPLYGQLVDDGNDRLNLSWLVVDQPNVVMLTELDRLAVEFTHKKTEVRVGRQRINWGISTVWNPMDLFNTFSFFDFDYEERPGSDALRVQHYLGSLSRVEVAANFAAHSDDRVVAALYRTNKHNYDWQWLAAFARNELVAGFGWAGNVGNTGFKGEATFFQPLEYAVYDNSALAITASIDYSFDNGVYSQVGMLYNSSGANDVVINDLAAFGVSARSLSPFRSNVFFQAGGAASPLLNLSMVIITEPVHGSAFFSPSLTYSAANNLDLTLVAQTFFSAVAGDYQNRSTAIFTRGKWSF